MTKTSNKILIIGLGNPGHRYKKTRHNIGFRVIDALKKEVSARDVLLFKPQTYMNQSGRAVKKIIQNSTYLPARQACLPARQEFKIQNSIVVHDDVDLPLGIVRISKNVSSAGHKGVQSIIDELETQDFARIRIGIKPKIEKLQNTENFVLQKFSKEEEKNIKKVIKKTVEIIKESLKQEIRNATIKI